MALITRISGRPLFSTIQEAISWANSRGLTGTHTHTFEGQLGYMGGANHNQAVNAVDQDNAVDNDTNNTTNTFTTGGGTGY